MKNNVFDFSAHKKSKQIDVAATFCVNMSLNQCLFALAERIVSQYEQSIMIDQPIDEHEVTINEQIIDNIREIYKISTEQIHHIVETSVNALLLDVSTISSNSKFKSA
jgi:hypothetical protein